MKTLQKTLQGAAVVAAFVASASVAKADLSFNGAVGLPLNPTAQIPAKGAVTVQANYYDQEESGFKAKSYGLYAAGQVADGFEINGGIEKFDTDFNPYNRSGFALGAKYLFTHKSDPSNVQFAVGAGYSRSDANNVYAYGVASKAFNGSGDRAPIIGHLGVRFDRFDYDFVGGDKSDKTSIYGGVEIPFTRKGDLAFVGELQSRITEFDSLDAPYSAGIRYHGRENGISATVGVQRRPFFINSESRVFAQLGYTFGGGDVNDEVSPDNAVTMPTTTQ